MSGDRRAVLVIATRNPGKLRELRRILDGLPFEMRSLSDYPDVPPMPEDGVTYTENAVFKARNVARLTGQIAIADDSGIEVDHLDGGPGVHSARFLGDEATDDDRNREILRRLEGVPTESRTARFRAVVAVGFPDGSAHTFEGVCEGMVALRPRGEGGFGYDPIFYIPDLDRTVAELAPEEKDRISHRGAALRRARDLLAAVAAGR